MVKYNRKEMIDKLFRSFDDEDFVRVMLVNSQREMEAIELVEKLEERRFPLVIVSRLVNVQRGIYDLPCNTHRSYCEIKEDAVVVLVDEFNSEDLKLVLSALVVELRFMRRTKDFKVKMDLGKVINNIRNSSKYLSSWNNFNYNTEEFIQCLTLS